MGFNRAYELAFGVKGEDLLGKRVLDLTYLPEADRLAYQAEDEATIASCGTVEHMMDIPLADGLLHKTRYFVAGIRLADGSPGGLVGSFFDLGLVEPADNVQEAAA
jgi:two-component system sensor histidine kinase/response regulator